MSDKRSSMVERILRVVFLRNEIPKISGIWPCTRVLRWRIMTKFSSCSVMTNLLFGCIFLNFIWFIPPKIKSSNFRLWATKRSVTLFSLLLTLLSFNFLVLASKHLNHVSIKSGFSRANRHPISNIIVMMYSSSTHNHSSWNLFPLMNTRVYIECHLFIIKLLHIITNIKPLFLQF